MNPLRFLGVLTMLLYAPACDLSFQIPLNLSEAVCDVLNPAQQTCPDDTYYEAEVPRQSGEFCNSSSLLCEEELVCACGICVDLETLLDTTD